MAPSNDRPIPDVIEQIDLLDQSVMKGVAAFVDLGAERQREVEELVLHGAVETMAAIERLAFLLESARSRGEETEPMSDMLAHLQQELAFFQGCTMRRSAGGARQDQAEVCAREAEQLALEVQRAPSIDRLVETYKMIEALEARIAGLRGSLKTSGASERRVLDVPRARVLVARRAVGAAIAALDDDDQ